MVIMATILLLERDAREHDQTAVSLWFSERSSLYRISVMGVLSHYYHLFNQNFTGRHDNRAVREENADRPVGSETWKCMRSQGRKGVDCFPIFIL